MPIMRESLAGLAWIECHVGDQSQWLLRWSSKWRRYALVGGHVEEGESFRDCTIRETHEELGLTHESDFHVSDEPLVELAFEEFSESAQEQTRYRFSVFGVTLDSANAQYVALHQIELRWVTPDEIESGATTDGRPIASQVQRVWQAMQSGDSQPMTSKPLVEEYDFFVSYARADNVSGWVERFLEALVEEHRQFTGGRPPKFFFDRADISNFADWESQIFHKGLTKSRLFLAFLSPAYFASGVCRREWQAWIDQEIATHILSSGAAPIYFVEVPGFVSKPMLTEHEVAQKVGELCKISTPLDQFTADVSPVVQEFRRRQLVAWVRDQAVQPFFHSGVVDLQQEDLRRVLRRLAEDLDTRSEDARRAIESVNTVPAYNKKFTGRLDELLELRRMLQDDRTGVVCGVAGLGGIGKSELAFTYAHAFASVYPGGRFYIGCDGQTDLRQALLQLGDFLDFHTRVTDDERKALATYFPAVLRCLTGRLAEKGHVLLILDNVSDPALVSSEQTDVVTVLGPKLHLLATTRLLPSQSQGWLTLGELRPEDALALLEKHRPFADESERQAGREIVRKLGGFALAVELVAAGLAAHPSARYSEIAAELRLDDLEHLAEDQDVKLKLHNHEKRLQAVLQPTLSQLTPAERRVLEYAALLAPDHVPYPWLRELTIADFPELAQRNRWGDPWEELCRKLERLALFTRADGEGHCPRLVRMHRLVQELVRRNLIPAVLVARQSAIVRLAQHFIAQGDPDSAREVVDAGIPLATGQLRLQLRLLKGLALARSGATEAASRVLCDDELAGLPLNDELRGLEAVVQKHLGLAVRDPAAQTQHLQRARDLYHAAWKEPDGSFWTGINVASLHLLLGERSQAAEVAREVELECLAVDKAQRGTVNNDPYWLWVTLGEACLSQGKLAEAEDWYRRAAAEGIARNRMGNLNSVRRQLRWLLSAIGEAAVITDAWLPIPGVAVFTGHRIDAPDRAVPRFPKRLELRVRDAITRWLVDHQIRAGVSSAANGADILFLEALQSLEGSDSRVVLPFSEGEFIATSVRNGADDSWVARFEAVMKRASSVTIASRDSVSTGSGSFEYANRIILGKGLLLTRELQTSVCGLAVWDGKSADRIGSTADSIERWRQQKFTVHTIDLNSALALGSSTAPLSIRCEGTECDIKPVVRETSRATPNSDEQPLLAMLFADAVGFSKLSDREVKMFGEHFLGRMAQCVQKYAPAMVIQPDLWHKTPILVRATWENGLYFAMSDVRTAGLFALDLRETIANTRWKDDLHFSTDLELRIVLHCGPAHFGRDPITGLTNGTQVSRAADLEPKTLPNHVFASVAFASVVAEQHVTDFTCEYVKLRNWAKHYGTFPAYVVQRKE